MPRRITRLRRRFPRVVFVRVGWMKFYLGAQPQDPLLGGGAFNDYDVGNEHENFKVQLSGWCEGWYQPPGGGRGFKLRRIDPSADANADQHAHEHADEYSNANADIH